MRIPFVERSRRELCWLAFLVAAAPAATFAVHATPAALADGNAARAENAESDQPDEAKRDERKPDERKPDEAKPDEAKPDEAGTALEGAGATPGEPGTAPEEAGATPDGGQAPPDQPAPPVEAAPPAEAVPATGAGPADRTPRAAHASVRRSRRILAMPLRLTIDPRVRARWSPDSSDRDSYVLLGGELGDRRRGRISAVALGRLAWDMGRGAGDVGSDLSDLDDANRSFYARLYHAYVEGRDFGPVAAARAGRVFLEDTPEWLQLDGVRVRSTPLVKSKGLYLEAYGGVPAHYWAPRSGDFVAGVMLGLRPWKTARFRADWMYLADDNYAPGQRTQIYGGSLWQQVGDSLNVLVAGHGIDEQLRDARAQVVLFRDDIGLSARLGAFVLLSDRRRVALSADRLDGVLFDEQEYVRGTGYVEKAIGKRVALGGGADVRALVDAADESPFNRSVQRFWVGPRVRGWPAQRLDFGLTTELWLSHEMGTGGGEVATVGADASYRLDKRLRVRVGTDYASYRRLLEEIEGSQLCANEPDLLMCKERVDSRRFYVSADARHEPLALRGRVRYELESAMEGVFHTLWVSLGVSL